MAMFSLASSAQMTLTPVYDAKASKATDTHKTIVENRLRSVITSMKLVSGANTRFVLACKTVPLQTEVAGTKIVQKLEATFAVGDAYNNTCFATQSMELTGIGNTEEQALTNALKNIKNSPQLRKLVDRSKQRIVDYYNNNAASIIQKASVLLNAKEWELALCELVAIPEECNLYEQALAMMEKVYNAYLTDEEGRTNRVSLSAACREAANAYMERQNNGNADSRSFFSWW